jgi:flagella basal body P-ring formation protein FlgA
VIFYEFKDSLDTHLIVHDNAFKESLASKKTLKALKKFSKSHSLSLKTQEYSVDEDSFESILKLIAHIKSLESNLKNVYINTTDGLSNIGVVLGSKLLNKGVKILAYDMYENSYNLTTNSTIITKKLKSKMSIKEHFALKGLKIRAFEKKKFAHKNAKQIKKLFESHYEQFVVLKRDITSGTKIKAKKYVDALQIIRELNLNTFTQKKEITGGLFEWYVYLLVKDLGFDDIEVGVVIEDSFSDSAVIRNEFDILLMKENHLNMIECKFTKRIDVSALVYKYSNLINLIDDDGRMIILTDKETYSHDLYEKSKPQLELYRRALLNKILIRGSVIKNREKFLEDVKSYLKL